MLLTQHATQSQIKCGRYEKRSEVRIKIKRKLIEIVKEMNEERERMARRINEQERKEVRSKKDKRKRKRERERDRK